MTISRARRMANAVRSIVEQADPAGELTLSGSGTQPYTNIADLPLTGNTTGAEAFVSENNRLYIWNGTGWYNIALVNTSPTAITGADGSYAFATDGTPIEITLVSTDPEGIPITWSYAVTSGSLTNGGGTTATVSQAANVFTITPSTNEDYIGSFSLTFTASDGVNLATATSSFTLQFRILNSKYTTLMLKAESSGLNTTFVDSSTNNFAITRNGDVTQGTFSPYSKPEGAWSNYFDGSGDVLTLPISAGLNLGNSDFTVEAWVFRLTSSGNTILLCGQSDLNTAAGSSYGFYITGTATSDLYIGGSGYGVSTPNPSIGVWAHVAYVRTGGTFSSYLNGVRVGTVSVGGGAVNVGSSGNPPTIGAFASTGAAFNGYISNLRLVKGTVYDATQSTITVPTDPLTAVSGTSLLTCQSNRFKDNSTNNFAITKTGDVKVTAFGPYDQMAYDPAVNGGSAYFDGTGDWLQTPSSTEFNITGITSYTIESWFYPTSLPAGSKVIISSYNSSSGGSFVVSINGSNTITVSTGNDTSSVSGTTVIKTGQWYHIVVVRDGTTSVKVYLNGVLEASGASFNWTGSTQPCFIGTYSTGLALFTGYISNARITKGAVVYTGNFTPPTAPLTAVAGTSLLLKCTNGNIVDYSGNSNLAVIGNTVVNTTTTKYAAGSIYFDGTGDYLSTAANAAFDFGTGDFTIECWVWPVSNGQNFPTFLSSVTGWSAGASGHRFNNTGYPNKFWFGLNGSGGIASGDPFMVSTSTYNFNTWHHYAITRSGNTWRMFVNGSLENTQTYTGSYNCGLGGLRSGWSTWDGANGHFTGYIEDLRITKGLARYTANFTPPTSELSG